MLRELVPKRLKKITLITSIHYHTSGTSQYDKQEKLLDFFGACLYSLWEAKGG